MCLEGLKRAEQDTEQNAEGQSKITANLRLPFHGVKEIAVRCLHYRLLSNKVAVVSEGLPCFTYLIFVLFFALCSST